MRRRLLILVCAALLAACAHTGTHALDGDIRSVPLPRTPAAGEQVLLEVELGVVGTGTRIMLRMLDGRLIGTVSPHGIREGMPSGTYLVPVPESMLDTLPSDMRLQLRVQVEASTAQPRPASAEEVRDVRVVILTEQDPH